jgi:hypothetical protein
MPTYDERAPNLQGETWVFTDALHLSSQTLARINGPLKLEREYGVLNPISLTAGR